MSYFQIGELLTAKAEAQGLELGRAYEVLRIDTRSTLFGDFVSYLVGDSDGEELLIQNGHLLLRKLDEDEEF